MNVLRHVAMARRTHHAFSPGAGYTFEGPLPLPAKAVGTPASANPPLGTKDGSTHLLHAPANPTKIFAMQWVAGEAAWQPITPRPGRRIAFEAQYLGMHGWVYLGPTQ